MNRATAVCHVSGMPMRLADLLVPSVSIVGMRRST
jgi:hypothetical protein